MNLAYTALSLTLQNWSLLNQIFFLYEVMYISLFNTTETSEPSHKVLVLATIWILKNIFLNLDDHVGLYLNSKPTKHGYYLFDLVEEIVIQMQDGNLPFVIESVENEIRQTDEQTENAVLFFNNLNTLR